MTDSWVGKISARRILKVFIYFFLILFALLIPYFIADKNILLGGGVLGMLIGVPIAVVVLVIPRIGFFLIVGYSSSIMFFKRLTGLYDAPMGVLVDGLILLTFLGVLFEQLIRKKSFKVKFQDVVFYILAINVAFFIIQAFNPNAVNISGWVASIRGVVAYLLFFYMALYFFRDFNFIQDFTRFWVLLAFSAALYGMFQEYFGLPWYDRKWVFSDEALYQLNFVWGRFRVWSFLSDSANFGVFMAFSSIFCLIMAIERKQRAKRITYLIFFVCMILAMAYSGTRTAYAILPAGLVLYILYTLQTKRSIIFGVAAASVFMLLLFGPIHNPLVERFRSAFNPQEDASMKVREVNKSRIQPYIRAHPIGGGIFTTGNMSYKYNPDHELSGFPPDSGYLRTALELGYIGLIIQLLLFASVQINTAQNYYLTENTEIKALYLAYACAFFSMTIADLAQAASEKYPISLIFYCTYAIFINLKFFVQEENQMNLDL